MKVVFDSNIFVSALILPGGRAEAAMRRILDGHDRLIVSPEIINEVLRVLADKFSRDREELSRVAVLLSEMAETVKPRARLSILRDEPDNRILECATAGDAHLIVTGDKALLALGVHEGIRIISLKEYIG